MFYCLIYLFYALAWFQHACKKCFVQMLKSSICRLASPQVVTLFYVNNVLRVLNKYACTYDVGLAKI